MVWFLMFLDLGIKLAPPNITLHCTDSPFFVRFAGTIFAIRRGVGRGQKGEKTAHPRPMLTLIYMSPPKIGGVRIE